MSLLKYFKPKPDLVHDRNDVDSGILIFDSTSEVIRAEKILKQKGWNIRVMGPPPQVRTGCDLVIEFPLMEEMNILRTLDQADIAPRETAPHPFYTRGFILHDERRAPELISRAYAHKNAARNLLVKGERDYVVHNGSIVKVISEPSEEAMEAVGGTGDTLTGLVSVLIEAGLTISDASVCAAVANRLAGCLARPTPATTIMEIISHIPASLHETLAAWELPSKKANATP